MKRIAINGLGRTGKLILKEHLLDQYADIEVVAVNDLTPIDNLAYLLRYDSVHGKPGYAVNIEGDRLYLGQHGVQVFSEQDPTKLPWQELDIDLVIDCTGKFTERSAAEQHLQAGAKKVLIGAPSKDADFVVVLGVNDDQLDPAQHTIVSNASCTTNSLAPPIKVLDDSFGIEEVCATTVHSYTASQGLVDKASSRMHRGRAAALSLIPTTTGADKATVQVLPQLKDKISALAIRVPVPDGALTDITARVTQPVSVEQVNSALNTAATGQLKNILAYSEEELVSIDIIGEPHSAIVHAKSTSVVNQHLVKLFVWYDNEFGYARRCLDVSQILA